MTYQQTIDFLFSQLPAYHRIGKAAYKNDLDNTILLDNYLGNPHFKYRTIHVGGTNGKGSVSHMIASVLQEAGYLTGLYTSPHLKDFRERIKVNGEMISEEAVVTFVNKHKAIIESLKPSFFEMTVAMAFDYFAKKSVEIAVIEVGLGGRLDSTNIIDPVLSVITNIGHDHMDLLGNTLEKIASEKAGIIKVHRPVIISETQAESENIFILKAEKTESEISFADKRFKCIIDESTGFSEERKYKITDLITHQEFEGKTVLTGDYQEFNLKAVYAVFAQLKPIFRVSDTNIKDGISKVVVNTGLSGRWQILNHSPITICDTGHNREGLKYVIAQINKIHKSKLHMIIGFVNDKDLGLVLPLFPVDAIYYFARASVPRALDEKILKDESAKYDLYGKCYSDVKTALADALKNAGEKDVIFIGGSTFIVADVLKQFDSISPCI
jgi:dihydrofolate synthase/folylpolyglutamate synthase